MLINDIFPSEFLRAADLQGNAVTCVIAGVEMRDIGGESKPALLFQGKKKALILNKTNGTAIASFVGSDDTTEWVGRECVLFEAQVAYQGKVVPAIRIRAPRPKPPVAAAATAAPPPAQRPPMRDEMDDEIPF